MKDNKPEIPPNEEPHEKDSPQTIETQPKFFSRIVENQHKLRMRKVLKAKDLALNEIDYRLISFHLVEENNDNFIRKIPIILQVEDDPKIYNEEVTSRDFFLK